MERTEDSIYDDRMPEGSKEFESALVVPCQSERSEAKCPKDSFDPGKRVLERQEEPSSGFEERKYLERYFAFSL